MTDINGRSFTADVDIIALKVRTLIYSVALCAVSVWNCNQLYRII